MIYLIVLGALIILFIGMVFVICFIPFAPVLVKLIFIIWGGGILFALGNTAYWILF